MTGDETNKISDIIFEAKNLEDKNSWYDAANKYREAIKIAPLETELWFKTAICLKKSGQITEAIQFFEKASMLGINNPQIELEFGNALHHVGRFEEAIEIFMKIRDLNPENSSATNNLAMSLQASGRLGEAEIVFSSLLKEHPDDAEITTNYAAILIRLSRIPEALENLRHAINIDTTNANAWSNLGIALQAQLKINQALRAHSRASNLAPENHRIRYNQALALLLSGNLKDGLREFEHRRQIPEITTHTFNGEEWSGQKLSNIHLLVHAEQGLGDTIQFARFLPVLTKAGAKVHLVTHTALIELFVNSFGNILESILAPSDPLPQYDYHTSILSLAYKLGVTLKGLQHYQAPYLKAPNCITLPIKKSKQYSNIGIVWSGNSKHPNDENRSCSLAELAPLFHLERTKWISLQVGPRATDINNIETEILDISKYLTDFSRTAAIISQLDLVIAVDTAALHLSGAIGARTIALLPFEPDWRWMIGRYDSPWYPTLRLFRQDHVKDWSTVVNKISLEIQKF